MFPRSPLPRCRPEADTPAGPGTDGPRAGFAAGRLCQWLNSRITRRMLGRATAVGVGCAILFSTIYALGHLRGMVDTMGAELDRIGATFAPTLAESVWAFDEAQTELQLDSLVNLPGVAAANVTHDDAVHTAGATIPPDRSMVRDIPLLHRQGSEVHALGTLRLVADIGEVRAAFLHTMAFAFLENLLVGFVVTLSMVLVYQESVIARLLAIARGLRDLSAEDLKQVSPDDVLDRPTRIHDELDELAASVIAMRHTARKALLDLEHVALHDPLTGLINRRALGSFMDRRLARGAPETDSFAVLHVDLDGFKAVNDSHGHAAGDTVLLRAANCMRHRTKSTDCIARVGGDEFVIVLDDVRDREQAGYIAARIIEVLSRPQKVEGVEVRIGASIGIAFRSVDDNTADRLLMNADIATYEAKSAGRGQFSFYADGAREALEQRLSLADDFREGLARGEVTVFFQPQMDMKRNRLVGFESLVRWRHPKLGLLRPNAFLDIVLETGLSQDLTMAVVEEVLGALNAWRRMGIEVPKIGVNLSATQLRNREFIRNFEETVWKAAISPRQIAIEVLESVLVEEVRDPVVEHVRELSDLGFPIELDDFGTGYSSVSNLVSFDVDLIKIDRRFVAGIERDSQQQTIFAALHTLARNLGLDVLAEGVETEAECETLRELGCSLIQGYYIAEPMDFDSATRWLEDSSIRIEEIA